MIHRIGTRDEWRAARDAPRRRDKSRSRAGDEPGAARQWLDRAPKGRRDDTYWHRRRHECDAVGA